MRLATYNLESFGEDRFRPERLEKRVMALRPRLSELAADILCLQEVNAQKPQREKIRQFTALELLLDETPYSGYYRATSLREDHQGPSDRHNLVVLSRFPILKVKVLYQSRVAPISWRPQQAEPAQLRPAPLGFERPILQVEIDVGVARPFHLFVVHLRAPIASAVPGAKVNADTWKSTAAWAEGYFLSAMQRAAQALELRLAVDALLDEEPDALIAIAGDFNATGDSGPLRLVAADPEDTGNSDLAYRQLFQLDEALAPDARRTVLHRGKGQALDHILASRSLHERMTDIRVFNQDLTDEVLDAAAGAGGGSFHAAVCAGFSL